MLNDKIQYSIKLTNMANSKSAIKRIKINKRNKSRNKFYKTAIRTSTKAFLAQIHMYDNTRDSQYLENAEIAMKLAYKLIDKSTKKNIFHKNRAARKKSSLALSLKQRHLS